jgi:long-subunit fatty acid transport protein
VTLHFAPNSAGEENQMINTRNVRLPLGFLVLAAVAAAFLAWARPVFAGGFFLYEIGTPDVGLASAGYAARAQDASTVFTNPAGMTMLDNSQLLAGIQPIYGHLAGCGKRVLSDRRTGANTCGGTHN